MDMINIGISVMVPSGLETPDAEAITAAVLAVCGDIPAVVSTSTQKTEPTVQMNNVSE